MKTLNQAITENINERGRAIFRENIISQYPAKLQKEVRAYIKKHLFHSWKESGTMKYHTDPIAI